MELLLNNANLLSHVVKQGKKPEEETQDFLSSVLSSRKFNWVETVKTFRFRNLVWYNLV
jgi:hypothetical protein